MDDVLLLNIGNTHTDIAWADLAQIDVVKTSDLMAELDNRNHQIRRLIVSSVVPKITGQLCVKFGQRLTLLNADQATSLDFSHVDKFTIGADRIANAMAAQNMYGEPVMIIDCGTCITTEIIAPKGFFMGGNILPGRMLQRKVLVTHTGQLPLALLCDSLTPSPGKDTMTAIQSGVDMGLVGAIDRLIHSNSQPYPKLTVVLTGGDADFFAPFFPKAKLTPKHFTLSGLRNLL